MPEGSSTVKDTWARSIKIKELQEELGKLRTESWSLIQAERYEEAFALKKRAEDLERGIEGLKNEEARARQKARVARDAALASKGIVAVPTRGDRIMELQEELEQARLAGDLERTIEARKAMLALQDGASQSSSSAARPRAALPAPSEPLAITDATNPDFDPRESTGAEFVVPVPKRRSKPVTSEIGLSGRAAERYTAMHAELQEAIENNDDAAAADTRRRLEIFRGQFLEKRDNENDDGGKGEGRPERGAHPRSAGRNGGGKGRGKAREEQVDRGDEEQAVPAKGRGKARPRPAAAQAAPAEPAPSADQSRAKKQVEAWKQEVVLLEQGLLDYRGDEDCKEALDLRQRRDGMSAKIRELEQAATVDGPALQAALRAIDQASNPDTREAQLAALARFSKVLHKS